jgi:hypothetical protein
MGPYPGAETAITPDEPDVLDAGDVVEGVGEVTGDVVSRLIIRKATSLMAPKGDVHGGGWQRLTN